MERHKLRSYVYIEKGNGGSWWLSGVQFREFLQEYSPANLLLLEHQHLHATRHPGTGFDFVAADGLKVFGEDDHYQYGDLAVLDLPDISRLNGFPKQAVAELLYFAHAWEPLSTPFLPHLENRLAYLTHDDGWMAKVWVQPPTALFAMIGGVIASRLGRVYRRRVRALPSDLLDRMQPWAAQGVLVDFTDSRKTVRELTVPLYVLGGEHSPFSEGGLGIDDLLNNMDDYKASSQNMVLRYGGHAWTLEP